jgi:hypothetical protein
MPKIFLKYWDNVKNSEHTYAPIILGALTFFLPCGFTQSMQLFAMGSGNFWAGGTTLALFALGTMPILLGIGIISSKIHTKENILFKLIISIIIIIFGWYSLASGFAVLGIALPTLNTKKSPQQSTLSNEQLMSVESVQTIYMTVDYTGYTPNTFTLQKNKPVRWLINVTQITGCTNEIIVPSLNIKKQLELGQNIITFTPTEAGSIGFSCWMGMVRGTFNVK